MVRIAVLRTLSGLNTTAPLQLAPIFSTAATFRAVIRTLAAALASASSSVQMV
jgi:hypothetical protein